MAEGVTSPLSLREWELSVPAEFRNDALWKVEAYRLAQFLADICWLDVTRLARDRRTVKVADQLFRASGSIAANIAEGFSCSSRKNRARYYEYALGSARESRTWYYQSRRLLTE